MSHIVTTNINHTFAVVSQLVQFYTEAIMWNGLEHMSRGGFHLISSCVGGLTQSFLQQLKQKPVAQV